MKKRLMLAVLTLFLLILPFSYAQDFGIYSKPVKDRVAQGEWAMFDVMIENNQSNTDTFKLSSKVEGTEWSILTESTFDYTTGVVILPRSRKSVRLLLKDKDLPINLNKAYLVDISAKSTNTGEKKTELMQVFIVAPKYANVESDITVSPNVPRYIDPRNIYSFVVNIKNNNPKNIKNLDVKLGSNLFAREAMVELPPDMQKAVESTVGFDENQKPLLDTLTVTVSEDGKELYRETVPIEIVSYRIPFDQESAVKEFFLKTVEDIKLTNKEVVWKQQRVMLPLSPLDALFVTALPEAMIVEKEGKKNLAWDVKLAAGKSINIRIITNYRMPFYIIVGVIIIIMIYYVFRDPIVAVKSAESVKREEGGISELKVILNLRNRSKKELNKVTVIERLPQLVQVEKKHDLGTLTPKRIMSTKKGVLMVWELEMDPHEERLIKYMIKSRLSILGRLRLQPASILAETKDGMKRKIRSNEVYISED